jgi:hypothetical protein
MVVRISEQSTFTSAIAPTTVATVTASSSELVDMSQFSQYLVVVGQGTATTAGVTTVSIWESTSPTWAGAVATQITASVTVGTSTTSPRFVTVEIKATQITEGKRYLGVYVQKADTASGVCANIVRELDRYKG